MIMRKVSVIAQVKETQMKENEIQELDVAQHQPYAASSSTNFEKKK